jgi:hypothetical protein
VLSGFVTYRVDNKYEEDILKIFLNYSIKGPMVFDLMSVIPTIASG